MFETVGIAASVATLLSVGAALTRYLWHKVRRGSARNGVPSGSLLGDDQEIVRDLLLFLGDRRILYDPMYLENPDHVMPSVLRTRDEILVSLRALPEGSYAIPVLQRMTRACRMFLSKIPPSARFTWLPGRGRRIGAVSNELPKLRSEMYRAIADLCAHFDIPIGTAGEIPQFARLSEIDLEQVASRIVESRPEGNIAYKDFFGELHGPDD